MHKMVSNNLFYGIILFNKRKCCFITGWRAILLPSEFSVCPNLAVRYCTRALFEFVEITELQCKFMVESQLILQIHSQMHSFSLFQFHEICFLFQILDRSITFFILLNKLIFPKKNTELNFYGHFMWCILGL